MATFQIDEGVIHAVVVMPLHWQHADAPWTMTGGCRVILASRQRTLAEWRSDDKRLYYLAGWVGQQPPDGVLDLIASCLSSAQRGRLTRWRRPAPDGGQPVA